MAYQYRMVQFTPSVIVTAKEALEPQVAAHYFEGVISYYATNDWEFYRVDTIQVIGTVGCLAALFGARRTNRTYSVLTFRKSI